MAELILNREKSRRVDVLAVEKYGMTGLVLMENAGRNAASFIQALLERGTHGTVRRITICCGKGNNGGDGFVVARHLDANHVPVKVLIFCDPATLTGDAAANYEIIRRAGLPLEVFAEPAEVFDKARLSTSLAGSEFIVDALLGTGSHGEPRPPLDQVIDAINGTDAKRIAIDIPSGLDCDTGEPAKHTIRADHTLTFVARKPGFLKDSAQAYLGTVHVLDIGVPRKLLEELVDETATK
jgi:NAD(P)H-hydrate epimerase